MANNNISIRLMLFVALLIGVGNAQPTPSPACSDANLLGIITRVVSTRVASDPRMGASLLRLHFHDCFVNGCDGSVLLDDKSTTGFVGEKSAGPNANSLRGFDVIDTIKSQVEAACPRRLSCADILAVAAREGVVAAPIGGPSWPVALGRLDSTTANFSGANTQLPGPGSSLQNLIDAFRVKGFNTNEMVALSGSHTIGQARCLLFRNRIYNEANINATFATATRARCPSTSGSGDNNLSPLDVASPNAFNNDYYRNLINLSGLLHSDQVLFNNVSTDALVRSYASNPTLFANDFARAMAKMARLPRPAGAAGQIRTNCRRVN